MTEFSNKPSYEEIFTELSILQMTNSKLNNENKRLRRIIQKIQDDQGLEICEYFSECKSISRTADNYYFDDVEDCYWALVEYFGCSDPLQRANDYVECYKVIFGSDSENNEYDEDDEDNLAGEKISEDKNTENIAVVENLDEN
jgi:hypothetical protein